MYPSTVSNKKESSFSSMDRTMEPNPLSMLWKSKKLSSKILQNIFNSYQFQTTENLADDQNCHAEYNKIHMHYFFTYCNISYHTYCNISYQSLASHLSDDHQHDWLHLNNCYIIWQNLYVYLWRQKLTQDVLNHIFVL